MLKKIKKKINEVNDLKEINNKLDKIIKHFNII